MVVEHQAGGADSPPRRLDSPTRRRRPAFQRVSPVPEFPAEAVFDFESDATSPRAGVRSRRSHSAAVLSAC